MEELVIETIETYNEYLKNLPNGCLVVADQIRKNNISDALTNILHFSEGVTWLTQVAQTLNEQGVAVSLDIEPIEEYLNEVNDALTIQDYTLVADLFEYEFAPFFEEFALIEG